MEATAWRFPDAIATIGHVSGMLSNRREIARDFLRRGGHMVTARLRRRTVAEKSSTLIRAYRDG
jgi:hypothetical protein